MLSEIVTGGLKCVMNATRTTSLRTAAAGALAARYLAKEKTESIGFIGAGEEAKAHFRMIQYVKRSIKRCYVSSRTNKRVEQFIDELQKDYPHIEFVHCANQYQLAAEKSDIIVTAISSQEQVLKADWIKEGVLYIHVAGLEDEFAVAKKASKIVCDNWECVKHRMQTIVQMYHAGELKDEDIYADIAEIIEGKKPGRENETEFIYFNSVGLSVEDIMVSNRIFEKAMQSNKGIWIEK